jgi:hypothetical protein
MRKNKTYKGKTTKYQKARAYKQKKIFLLSCAFFLILGLNYERIMVNADVKRYTPVASEIIPESKPKVEITTLYTNRPDIETQIHLIAEEMGRKEWAEYLVKLSYCESRLDPNAVNDKGNNPADSKDRGLFQYNSYWQSHISDECAFDVRCATENTIKMIEAGKQHRWVCDKYVKGVPISLVINN